MSKTYYMKCGHTTTATLKPDNIPICPICLCKDIETPPVLINRQATCIYGCGSISPSSFDLPFFRYSPKLENDRYYCGCEGWN